MATQKSTRPRLEDCTIEAQIWPYYLPDAEEIIRVTKRDIAAMLAAQTASSKPGSRRRAA